MKKPEPEKPDALYVEGPWRADVAIIADLSDDTCLRYKLRVIRTISKLSMMPEGTRFNVFWDKSIPQGRIWSLHRYNRTQPSILG